MSGNDLGVPERAALLTLMAVGGEISNPELQQLAGFTLTGSSRKKLNQSGLVISRKPGRAFTHELTEQGWRWCAEELTAAYPPPRSGSLGGALYAILAGLHRYFDRTGRKLADVFVAGPEPKPAPVPAAPVPAAPVPESPASPAPDLAARVRAGYRSLAREPRAWVSLSQLRPLLGDVSQSDVDAVLLELSRTAQVRLVPQANQKILSETDRAAAVWIGGQANHLISIEDA